MLKFLKRKSASIVSKSSYPYHVEHDGFIVNNIFLRLKDPDNNLDDDFMLKAMGEGGGDDDSQGSDDDSNDGSQDWETDSDVMGGRSEDEFDDEVRS